MSFPRYPKYKPSGVEWLGEVPAHWQICKLGFLGTSGMGQTILREDVTNEPSENSLPVFSASEGEQVFGYLTNPQVVLNPGDIVIGARGSIGLARRMLTTATCTQTTIWFRPDLSHVLADYIQWSMSGGRESLFPFDKTAVPMLTVTQVRAGRIATPPLPEQRAIAAFLDRETAKIDALIAEQEKLIALLAEKRQAVISHAVTKGLNPNAPMKPSGVEWLGEVPAHWEVAKCGRFLDLLTGFPFRSEQFTEDDRDTRLLRGVNVGVGSLRWDETAHWRRTYNDALERFELQEGDLVLGMDRPWIAEGVRVARIEKHDLPCLLLQRVARLRSRGMLDLGYLESLLSSTAFVAHFEPETTGVSVPHISPQQICSFIVPVPPIAEQLQILSKVRQEAAVIGRLVADTESAITLLRERRAALISAAVTGQIDVRHLAPESAA